MKTILVLIAVLLTGCSSLKSSTETVNERVDVTGVDCFMTCVVQGTGRKTDTVYTQWVRNRMDVEVGEVMRIKCKRDKTTLEFTSCGQLN